MTELKEETVFRDFVAEVEKSPVFSNSLQNCELLLNDNNEALGLHKILEINIKDNGIENITVGVNEESSQSETEPNDDESVSGGIPDANINQEIINYVYENLLAKEINNGSLSNNLNSNDKVVNKLRATPKIEQLYDNGEKNASSSTTLEKIHERNCAIIKKDEDKLSLQSPVLVEGKCFISNNSIYFVSAFNQILKNSSIVRVKCESIISTKRAQELNIIPEWLKIKPDENQSFVFTSLLDKEDTYDSISKMIEYAMDSKQKLEANSTPGKKAQTKKQKNNLDPNKIKPSSELSEKVLIIKEIDHMIPLNLYPEEIKLLEEKEFYSDLEYASSLYINKDFKEVYYNVFSKINDKNPFYKFYQRIDPQGVNYDQFNELGDNVKTPSGYSFNFKYNVSLVKAKKRVYGLPARADINETVKLFFFDNCIILQTQINFISKIPLLKSFRAIVTAVLHNVPSEDDSGKYAAQIDMLYGAYIFKSTYFENFIISNLLPLLNSICLRFKVCVSECVRDIYKEKALRGIGIDISNINNIFRTSSNSSISKCGASSVTNNEKSRQPDVKNKTLTGFKNQIINPRNNKIIIKMKHIKNILSNYISEAMYMNPTVMISNKIANFTSTSLTILMYIYMNYIKNQGNSS
ncbi:conserved Plasmodium protein, unknown function [Plasmodium berghei]|uniref:GRAM domain-containing protein n=2 Tax=Plasmodium berghei TaxID=5821 RepID=A0A509AMF2_PLABA|nr:conserved Plasmodium protein, unknown function [Plasmodium berghei ANKA]CXI48511.1 conserved Plasmodium protein, unknown function [Plasmodium berghei]SCL93802.1 conserved Plasmodium protein, unknown function [Plasmodium berghei]SCM15880.1 conserved Plasmodium protein, unknown function [Plasmodium berghei]SCM17676.1 conserved Plasmodium protein, unknown function [Plasmodium berghei]SCN25822.1 conserved Plasmodium protein, unknown function [Plasmodium berghei]|eukprot:XP_034421805.1 conserved Plasmodium protein, unknown function [Plasmodium berghei ANKA]